MPNDPYVSGPFLGSNRNPYSYEKVEQVSRDILTSWLTLDEITNQLNLFQEESQDAYLLNLELDSAHHQNLLVWLDWFDAEYSTTFMTYTGYTGCWQPRSPVMLWGVLHSAGQPM